MATKSVIKDTQLDLNAILALVFTSFVMGSIFAVAAINRGRMSADITSASLWHTAVIAFPSVAALVLSSSLLGIVLMPICSFAYGVMLSWLCSCAVLASDFGMWLVVPQLFAMPVFFSVAVSGMDNSAVLCSAFFRTATKVRGNWSRRFAITLMSVAAVLLGAYLLT